MLGHCDRYRFGSRLNCSEVSKDDDDDNDDINNNNKQIQRSGGRGQQDVESEDKNCAVIIGALGTVKKGSGQNLQALTGHWSAIELQKVALISTAHSICKVLFKLI